MIGDFDYKHGLEQLKELLRQQASSFLEEFYVLEARLSENLQAERVYGSNESRRSERAQIIASLNSLTSRAGMGVSFNELCQENTDNAKARDRETEATAGPKYQIHIGRADHVTIGDKAQATHQEIKASEGSIVSGAAQVVRSGGDATIPTLEHQIGESKVLASLRHQLTEARENLLLIEERKAEYVREIDIPLQLVKEERRLRARIVELEAQIVDLEDQTTVVKTISIPAGNFVMGSDPYDPEAQDNEKPQHTIHLQDYEIGKYPVTNAQYQAFIQATGHPAPAHWPGDQMPPGKEKHPVVNVNLEDAQVFCRWLSKTTGRLYRLPTEEEWEKAARGAYPDRRRYPWGDEWAEGAANTKELGYNDTTPVDAFEEKNQSPFGVVDMAGNVWEWTVSWYERYPGSTYSSRNLGRIYRVVRGGSYYEHNDCSHARVACRGRYKPEASRPYLGFRIVIAGSREEK